MKKLFCALFMGFFIFFGFNLNAALSDTEKYDLLSEYRTNSYKSEAEFLMWVIELLIEGENAKEKVCYLSKETADWGMIGDNNFANAINLSTVSELMNCQ